MKYKLLTLLALLCVLGVILCAYFIKANSNHRYHQHLEARKEDPDKGNKYNTHLPIVKIDTDGQTIPGQNILDKDGNEIEHHATTPNGQDEIDAGIEIIDNQKKNNHLDDNPKIKSKIEINVRGASSRYFDKFGYKIKLITSDRKDNPQPVMGMDEHHEWVLHGPFLDKTLIRNYMWYNISGEIMSYAPNVRFCELFINGKSKGLYLMAETITSGYGTGRIDVEVYKKQNTYSGYIMRINGISKNLDKKANTFTGYTLKRDSDVEIVYPKVSFLNEYIKDSITRDFSNFEKALYSFDFNDKKYGYKKMINVDSFVDYFIINEFTCNYDVGAKSTYIYKDVDGKMNMCVWDFNNSCDNFQERPMNLNDFQIQNSPWYWMLFKDKDFVDKVIEHYKKLIKTTLSEKYLNNYIDQTIDYLGSAVDRNFKIWGYTFKPSPDYLKPVNRNPKNYKEAVKDLKSFIHKRGKIMDREIDQLKQYCKDSKIKKFIKDAN